jgi:hypothetical protein
MVLAGMLLEGPDDLSTVDDMSSFQDVEDGPVLRARRAVASWTGAKAFWAISQEAARFALVLSRIPLDNPGLCRYGPPPFPGSEIRDS